MALGMAETSASSAASAALELSYMAVSVLSAIIELLSGVVGVVGVGRLVAGQLDPLGAQEYRLADGFEPCPAADPHLLLEEQLLGDDEPLLQDRNDQHAVLLANRRNRVEQAADRDALHRDVVLPQRYLGQLLAGVDLGPDADPAPIDLARADLQLLLRQCDPLVVAAHPALSSRAASQ